MRTDIQQNQLTGEACDGVSICFGSNPDNFDVFVSILAPANVAVSVIGIEVEVDADTGEDVLTLVLYILVRRLILIFFRLGSLFSCLSLDADDNNDDFDDDDELISDVSSSRA